MQTAHGASELDLQAWKSAIGRIGDGTKLLVPPPISSDDLSFQVNQRIPYLGRKLKAPPQNMAEAYPKAPRKRPG